MCIVNTMATWGSSRRGSKGRPSLHVCCQHEGGVSFVPLCGVPYLQRVGSLRQEVDSPRSYIPLLVTPAPSSSSCRHSYAHHVIPASPNIILGSSHVILASSHVILASSHVILGSSHVILGSSHVIPASSHVIPAKAGIQPHASDAHSYAPAQGWTGARRVVMRNGSPVKWTIHTALGCAIIGTRMIRAELDCTRRQCGSPAGQRV